MTLRVILAIFIFFCFSSIGFASEQVFFYHTDPAGTPLSMTDSTGTVVWKADYKPFGEEYAVTGTAVNDKRFVGKEKDEETGLSYFGARYEDAKIGRFIAVDPVRVVEPATSKTNEKILLNPQRLNFYSYGLNNPYRYIDPDGREPLLNDVMSRIVSSEAFIRFGEAIGASQLNAALTGYDFRGNEFSGFDRASQFGIALISAPLAEGKIGMLGAKGTQFESKTVWRQGRSRIDAENPNPGQRPGQIHYQEGNEKYLYDTNKNVFQNAPNRINDLLKQSDVQKSISKAKKFLGE